MMSDEIYVHGTSAVEQARLSLMNRLINAGCLREVDLRGGERILDLGSGLGHFAREMARAAGPNGRVVGVERDERQLAAARAIGAGGNAPDLRHGEAVNPPLEDDEWSTFDVAHARFLLEHVQDPGAVVRTMVRAVRPGGRVVLADDDHDMLRVSPDLPGFVELWAAYARLYDRQGHDPAVGRRLPSLLHEAGARPVRCTFVFYGGCAGQPEFPSLVENLAGVLAGAKHAVVEAELYDELAYEEVLAGLERWSARPDAALWYAISWAEGRRPE